MKFLIFSTLITFSTSINITCHFNNIGFPVIGRVYSCDVILMDFSDNSTQIMTTSGKHLKEKTNFDVKVINLSNKNCPMFNLKNIPGGLLEIFPNFIGINFSNCSIENLSSEEFREYSNLEYFGFSFSNLTTLPGNLFEFTPNLKVVSFHRNKFENIGSKLLDDLENLESAWFTRNYCIDSYALNSAQIPDLIKIIKENCSKSEILTSTESERKSSQGTNEVTTEFYTTEITMDFDSDTTESSLLSSIFTSLSSTGSMTLTSDFLTQSSITYDLSSTFGPATNVKSSTFGPATNVKSSTFGPATDPKITSISPILPSTTTISTLDSTSSKMDSSTVYLTTNQPFDCISKDLVCDLHEILEGLMKNDQNSFEDIEKLLQKNKNTKSIIRELTFKVENFTVELEKIKNKDEEINQIKNLSKKIQYIEEQIKDSIETNNHQEDQIKELKYETESLNQMMRKNVVASEIRESILKDQIMNMTIDFTASRTELEKLSSSLEYLKLQLVQYQNLINELNKSDKIKNTKIHTLEEKIKIIEDLNTNLSNNNLIMQDQIQILNLSRIKFENIVKIQNQTIEEQQTKLEDLEKKVFEMENIFEKKFKDLKSCKCKKDQTSSESVGN